MELKFSRIAVLAPHTDDGEFGAGAFIARLIQEGTEVYYFAFSSADQSVPAGWPKDILKTEVIEATSVMGIPRSHLTLYNYEVRNFPSVRQSILEELVRIEREIKPDLVLLPCPEDTHQDHETVRQEGFRAFKRTTILGYELPWNTLRFSATCFVDIRAEHLQKKIEAIQCYKSQMDRPYAREEFLKGWAVMRGTQIGAPLAEAFQLVRWRI